MGRRRGASLQRRLFLGALVFVTLALVVAGLAIGLVLYRFARGQIDARLDGEIFAISADLKTGKDGPVLSYAHDGPPFDRPRSGWYWQVRTGEGILRSPRSARPSSPCRAAPSGRMADPLLRTERGHGVRD
ncbi:hypothetical protein ACFQWF_17935 [Methylorubrum suomiense]